MATTRPSADELLRAIQRLGMREIEELLASLVRLRAERSAPSLSLTETELLSRINLGLPEDLSLRYQELMAKRRAASLTPDEYRELLRLTDRAEALQAKRALHLAELAWLRGISLSALVEELGACAPEMVGMG